MDFRQLYLDANAQAGELTVRNGNLFAENAHLKHLLANRERGANDEEFRHILQRKDEEFGRILQQKDEEFRKREWGFVQQLAQKAREFDSVLNAKDLEILRLEGELQQTKGVADELKGKYWGDIKDVKDRLAQAEAGFLRHHSELEAREAQVEAHYNATVKWADDMKAKNKKLLDEANLKVVALEKGLDGANLKTTKAEKRLEEANRQIAVLENFSKERILELEATKAELGKRKTMSERVAHEEELDRLKRASLVKLGGK